MAISSLLHDRSEKFVRTSSQWWLINIAHLPDVPSENPSEQDATVIGAEPHRLHREERYFRTFPDFLSTRGVLDAQNLRSALERQSEPSAATH